MYHATLTLSNGVTIPQMALGTWFIEDNDAVEAVRQAVQIDYRHFDTAQAYGNERGVGEGIRTCGVEREALFVTSKVAAEHKSYDAAAASIEASLQTLGLGYIDLMLIHSPQPWKDVNQSPNRYFAENRTVWQALTDAYRAGKVRAIGVSNFLREDIDNLYDWAEVKPMVDQILCHITNTPLDFIEYCQRKKIVVEAYSPVAHGEALKNRTIAAIAAKYGVSIPQLCIRYDLQLGTVVLPKTANPAHMRSNAAVDFTITPEDMATLKAVPKIRDYGESSRFPVYGGMKK